MINKKFITGTIGLGLLLTSCGVKKISTTEYRSQKPNIIFILADDLGYGDLSCQGQERFTTPNIDRMAANGMIFTNHYSGCTVCAPSRSALMTGLHTGHTWIRGNKEHKPEGQEPLLSRFTTVAELLHSAGYTTGAFGKWGLGYPGSEGDPNNRGFDEFFGFNCQHLAHNYYPYYLWHNQEKVILKGNAGQGKGEYAPEIIHRQALKFLDANKGNPFFMFYPTTIPHAELFAPEAEIRKFRGRLLPEKSYKGSEEGEGYKEGSYGSQAECHAAFAAMVTYLDKQVGEILDKLDELGITGNTLVIFTSDNGPHIEGGADPDYFNSNGPFRGHKRDLYEGGIRVPFIAFWPGKIKPGKTDHLSAFWDFMPTCCDLAHITSPTGVDGISYLPALLGKTSEQKEHEYLYWEFHEGGFSQAVRTGQWKGVKNGNDQVIELYDLFSDEGETDNIAGINIDVVKKIEDILAKCRTESEIWPSR